MYQCLVKNQAEMAQGSAELRLGGEFVRTSGYDSNTVELGYNVMKGTEYFVSL
jgi:hypothetical protein